VAFRRALADLATRAKICTPLEPSQGVYRYTPLEPAKVCYRNTPLELAKVCNRYTSLEPSQSLAATLRWAPSPPT